MKLKFTCPFCAHVHVFAPKGKSKHKKKFVGYTCPNCNRKVTEDDIRRKKGKGPKPKGERRKRAKKQVEKPVQSNPKPLATVPLSNEQLIWRTRDSVYVPPSERRDSLARGLGRRGTYRQPVDRSFGEMAMESMGINPSGSISDINMKEERRMGQSGREDATFEALVARFDGYEKRLALLVTRFDRVEERLAKGLEGLEPQLQNFAVLMSRMEELLDYYVKRRPSDTR